MLSSEDPQGGRGPGGRGTSRVVVVATAVPGSAPMRRPAWYQVREYIHVTIDFLVLVIVCKLVWNLL